MLSLYRNRTVTKLTDEPLFVCGLVSPFNKNILKEKSSTFYINILCDRFLVHVFFWSYGIIYSDMLDVLSSIHSTSLFYHYSFQWEFLLRRSQDFLELLNFIIKLLYAFFQFCNYTITFYCYITVYSMNLLRLFRKNNLKFNFQCINIWR